jgi:hypothetical protein
MYIVAALCCSLGCWPSCCVPSPSFKNPAHGVHSGFLVLRFYGSKSAFLHYVSQRGALGVNTLEEFSAIVEK